jgi:hypothetical protein
MLFLVMVVHTESTVSRSKKPVMADSETLLGEWDGDEFNGWRFIPYEVEEEPDHDVHEEEVKVWVARSQPRDKDTGAIAFDISFEYAQWKDHRVSILDLMDLEDNSFPYEEVTEAVNDWIEKAKRFPHTRRNCLCCWNRATKGKVLCQGCHTKFGEVIYAD